MSTVRLKQTLYWGAFALLVVAALTWGLDRILPNSKVLVIRQCHTNEKECTTSLSGSNASATLSFENGMHANKPMLLSFSLPDQLAEKVQTVQMTLQGKDHYMGVSTMELIQKSAPNEWEAHVLLPQSETNMITWQLEVTLTEDDGDHHSAWFEFDVKPGNPKQMSVKGHSFKGRSLARE